jgi:hypothetical protein
LLGSSGNSDVIRTEVVPDDRAFVVHVQASKPTAAGDWQKIFDELDHAMDEIEAKVTDDDTFCFQIRLRVEGFDTERFFGFEEGGEYKFTSHDPWDGYSPDFWRSALGEPASRQRVERWVSRYAKTLKCAEKAMRSTASLWEDDTTQFGEPLILLLATMDVTFVAHYEEFLLLWDLSHQVWIWPAVAALLEHHGVRPETSALAQIFASVDT